VIGHGVSIPVRTPTFPESSPRFCFAGRLCEEKGVRVLYNALLRLREEGGIFPVIDIIGDGHLLPWLQDRVKADFPGSPITLHGYLENPDDLIVRATALLFPSVRLDSAPYITLEAMALGVPVIASDLEVFRELIIPDVTGKVFHKGDSAALAKIMRQAMTETEAMRTMGMRGRELVRERHGIERMIAETAAFYRDVLLS
jgi:glycosyltransferase involved in cell wall biosynthesis